MLVRPIEPNPNWSTVGLRDYKNDWGHGGPWLQQRGPQPQTGAQTPRVYSSPTFNVPL